ncbi:DUF397 domain-containing protein [Streptomyces sp. NPDC056390]|uniref:DUF397 domain-containing protein n=1 Tax=Streptomyces sp. NPDC056390 TaxID=3345806 RepID=UPI0035D67A6C
MPPVSARGRIRKHVGPPRWFSSSWGSARITRRVSSGCRAGACVEVSDDLTVIVPVRDSKVSHGPVLVFPAAGWSSFVSAVKGGQLSA